MLTDELEGMSRQELLQLPKHVVLDLLGIDISATRIKCALLGLKVVKGASLGQPADWEDEGDRGDPTEAARSGILSHERPDVLTGRLEFADLR